ncbi:hypothetical protein VNI00_014054 [Paramarasmius palmivorus]|uniref:Uncharacterized protein n=1 Tax=Paramarasmius palmivorus TaxID=297713 RepID=A0AAW0BVW9_9AGAR
MRPPYGSYNDNVRWASAARGQTIVNWDFDSGDSAGQSVSQQLSNYDNKIWGEHPNTILALNHETYASTAYANFPIFVDCGHLLLILDMMSFHKLFRNSSKPDTEWSLSPNASADNRTRALVNHRPPMETGIVERPLNLITD